jgi:urease accessory protein UreF
VSWSAALERVLASEALWDEGVEVARNACVAGAPLASAAIAASAWYDNPLSGGRAMLSAFARSKTLPLNVSEWLEAFAPARYLDLPEFVAGFGFVDAAAAAEVQRGCEVLHEVTGGARLAFFLEHRQRIQQRAGALNVAGMCALVFADAGLEADQAERQFLLLRLAPALAAAQRAKRNGLAGFPFFEDAYAYEGGWPSDDAAEPCSPTKLALLKQAVGLDC